MQLLADQAATARDLHAATEAKETALRSLDQADQAQHQALLRAAADGHRVVYIGKIQPLDGRWLVKIGMSAHIAQRTDQLEAAFGKLVLTRVLVCEENTEFERALHDHMAPFRYKKQVKGCTSREVYLLTADQLRELENWADARVDKYRPTATLASAVKEEVTAMAHQVAAVTADSNARIADLQQQMAELTRQNADFQQQVGGLLKQLLAAAEIRAAADFPPGESRCQKDHVGG